MSSVYPSLGKKRPPFSLGKEILTIPFTSSTDGREHTLKKKGWSSPQPSNKEVWSSPQPPKRKRTPPPHAPKQKAPSQVVRGKRTELLSRRELLDHLARRFSVLRRSPLPLGRAFSLSQGRSSKLQNLTIEVLSSLRPATGNEKPSTSSNVMRKTRAPS